MSFYSTLTNSAGVMGNLQSVWVHFSSELQELLPIPRFVQEIFREIFWLKISLICHLIFAYFNFFFDIKKNSCKIVPAPLSAFNHVFWLLPVINKILTLVILLLPVVYWLLSLVILLLPVYRPPILIIRQIEHCFNKYLLARQASLLVAELKMWTTGEDKQQYYTLEEGIFEGKREPLSWQDTSLSNPIYNQQMFLSSHPTCGLRINTQVLELATALRLGIAFE